MTTNADTDGYASNLTPGKRSKIWGTSSNTGGSSFRETNLLNARREQVELVPNDIQSRNLIQINKSGTNEKE